MAKSKFSQLSQFSSIFPDAGDMSSIVKYKPKEAIISAGFVLEAMKLPQYQNLVQDAVAYGQKWTGKEALERTSEKLLVNFGCEVLKYIDGKISTQTDPNLSFKPKRTASRARRMAQLYKEQGVSPDRLLFKIAATWQGICAAEILEKEGIHCNMDLVFNERGQAIACADANITQISVGVGKITDWHKKNNKKFTATKDPGVSVVSAINAHYSKHGYTTVVRAQDFQTEDQAVALAGCNQLAIPTVLLTGLQHGYGSVTSQLTVPKGDAKRAKRLDDRHFYMRLCRDAVVMEKLYEGIRLMVANWKAMEKILKKKQSKL